MLRGHVTLDTPTWGNLASIRRVIEYWVKVWHPLVTKQMFFPANLLA